MRYDLLDFPLPRPPRSGVSPQFLSTVEHYTRPVVDCCGRRCHAPLSPSPACTGTDTKSAHVWPVDSRARSWRLPNPDHPVKIGVTWSGVRTPQPHAAVGLLL